MSDEHLRRAAEAVLKIRDPDRMWSGWDRAREQLMAELAAAEPHFRALHAEEAAGICEVKARLRRESGWYTDNVDMALDSIAADIRREMGVGSDE